MQELFKWIISGLAVILVLFACVRMEKREYLDNKELTAMIQQCADLNGTLRGKRMTQGDNMGKWRRSAMFCDFSTPPAKTPETTFENGTVFE